jgi:hypothetical protein
VEYRQHVRAGREILALGVVTREVADEDTMRAAASIHQQRQVAGERRTLVLRDQCRKAVPPHEIVQGRHILPGVKLGYVHRALQMKKTRKASR